MRLGILGGTFDPIHDAHLLAADAARAAARLDKVLFLPTGNPPHKADLAPAQDRLRMAELATEGLSWAEVSDLEMTREGTIYTVDTLTILKERRPGDDLFYIVGADALRDMPLWRDAPRAMTMCELVAVSRPGMNRAELESATTCAIEHTGAKVTPVAADCDISSTKIREAAARGADITGWVPRAVAAYIHEKGLYR